MFTTRRGLLAPQNTFLDTIIRRCEGQGSCFLLVNARILDFPIVYASDCFSNMMGFNRTEVLQKPGNCAFLYGPQTRRDMIDLMEQAFKQRKNDPFEVILYRKNLTARWNAVRIVPIRNEQEVVVLFLITMRDLTPYRQPVEDDMPLNSAFGALGVSGDATSSWGRFARLVFSLVRQKPDSDTGEENANDEPGKPTELLSEVKVEQLTEAQPFATESTTTASSKPPPPVKRPSRRRSGSEIELVKTDNNNCQARQPREDTERGQVNEAYDASSDRPVKQRLVQRLVSGPGRRMLTALSRSSLVTGQSRNRAGSPGPESDEHLNSHVISPESAPRYRPEPPRPPKHVLLHYSAFRLLWDWTILLLTGYTAVVVPLRLAVLPLPTWVKQAEASRQMYDMTEGHSEDDRGSPTTDKLAIFDAVIDVVFGLDIVLNFHTSFVGAGGEVVADPPIIRINYLSGWFTLDLISCLPYEIIKYLWTASNQEFYRLLDSLRIIRLLRIGRAARRIDQYLEYVSTLLLLMIVCFFLLAHWFACAWYAVGIYDLNNKIYYGWIPRYFNDSLNPQQWSRLPLIATHQWSTSSSKQEISGIQSDKSNSPNRVLIQPNPIPSTSSANSSVVRSHNRLPLRNAKDKWSAYVTALYFSLSLLTTIGFGNIAAFTEAEKLLSIGCMMVGALVYATIFGNVTTIVQQMYSTRTRYNDMMKGVKDFLRIQEVPQELGERVIDYITSSWSVNKGIDTAKVLNYCPKDMQADISVHLNRSVFNTHPAFRLASDGCKRSLAVNFNTMHTAPGDLIFHQGESIDQLCFIASGTLEVLQDDEVVAILGKGDVFGDPGWKNLDSIPSAASVRALTYCTLQTIRLERLRTVLQFYHAFANSFTRNLELTYNLSSRIIFRKLADVQREMELSLRQNKGPPLSSLPAGHPVRKLISRLRRPSQACDSLTPRSLATIMSNDSSFDASSDLDNSSASMTNIESDRRRSSNKSMLSSKHAIDTISSTPSGGMMEPVVPPPPDTMDALVSRPLDELQAVEPVERPPIKLILTGGGSGSVGGGGQGTAVKKWARLMSKATQPRLKEVSEVSEEGTNSSTTPAPSCKSSVSPDPIAPAKEPLPESTSKQSDQSPTGKLIESAISNALSQIGLDLQSKLTIINDRLASIEGQFTEFKQLLNNTQQQSHDTMSCNNRQVGSQPTDNRMSKSTKRTLFATSKQSSEFDTF